jgi:hypothetical protein
VCVFYRFTEEEPWSEMVNTDGVSFLPARSFTGCFQKGSSGAVELSGWDGFEPTEGVVQIPFLTAEGDSHDDEPEGRDDGVDRNSGLFDILSLMAFAGTVVCGVGVVVLVIGVGSKETRSLGSATT